MKACGYLAATRAVNRPGHVTWAMDQERLDCVRGSLRATNDKAVIGKCRSEPREALRNIYYQVFRTSGDLDCGGAVSGCAGETLAA